MSQLYYIFIYPIYITIESIFVLTGSFTHPLFSIFMVSLSVSLLCLPLYLLADKYYEQDIEIKKKLEPKIKSIKANFKGDERFFILNELYKRSGYSPFNQLKTIFGLIIQIFVFISAYKFFTDITFSGNASIWFINDLLKPDNAIVINNIKINILPIIMTIINIISAEVYLKIIKSNKRINSYIIALAFLILLYKSPSILVIYWTFNNIFSLIKNVIMLCIRRSKKDSDEKIEEEKAVPKQLTLIMILCCLSFMLLYSVFIPFQVYDDVTGTEKPYYIKYVIECLCTCIGLFLIYPLLYYFNCKYNSKVILTTITVSLLSSAIINFIFSNRGVERFSFNFRLFTNDYSYGNIWTNICLIIVFLSLMFSLYRLLSRNKCKLILMSILIIFISLLSLVIYNISKFEIDYQKENIDFIVNGHNIYKNVEKVNLSRNGENVIFLFIDSLTSSNLNQLLQTEPELINDFDGFTFFSNVKSLYSFTWMSLPSMLGGYEYSPEKMISEYPLKELQAMFLLPVIFSNNDYLINFCYYSNSADIIKSLNFYNSNINSTNLNNTIDVILKQFKNNKINVLYNNVDLLLRYLKENNINNYEYANVKSSIYYTICLTFPPFMKNFIYNHGLYLRFQQKNDSIRQLNDLARLYYITDYIDFNTDKNTYTVILNDIPHEQSVYNKNKKPYILNEETENYAKEDSAYNSFVIAILYVKKLIEYLKQNNVYDNTRIIIAGDHGQGDYPNSNATLILYKDFDIKGKLRTDNSYKILPEIPSMLLNGIVQHPINPFTGNSINKLTTKEMIKYPICSHYFGCYMLSEDENFNIGEHCEQCDKIIDGVVSIENSDRFGFYWLNSR